MTQKPQDMGAENPEMSEDIDPEVQAFYGEGSEQANDDGAAMNDVEPGTSANTEASDEMTQLRAQLDEAKDKMLRAVAEAENTRRRSERTIQDTRKYAVSGFAKDMLDVADNFRRALETVTPEQREANEELNALLGGVEATAKVMMQTFERHGIKKIEPTEGRFDPNFHEVMFEAEGTGKPAGEIIQLLEPGYVIHDRLLRPARVGVAKAEAGSAPTNKVDTEV